MRAVAAPSLSLAARLRVIARAAAATGVLAIALFFAYAIALIPFTPSIADLRKAKADTPSILMSVDGKQLAVFKRNNREWVDLKEISPHVVDALIDTEDHRFYQHHGVDFLRTAAGLVRTVQGRPEGGSTITQQLARNLYPEEIGRERSITRKLKELITALKIEYAYSKKEILQTYLNTVPFLYNAYGIEMAARTYFDKSAADLDVLESATLIGMLKGTAYYNPVLNQERARKRRNVVLAQMAKHGAISSRDLDRLQARPIRLDFERQPEELGDAPHFAAAARRWLIDWADRNDYNLYSDGLVIVSTIDSRLQKSAMQSVNRQLQMLQAVSDAQKGTRSTFTVQPGPHAARRAPPLTGWWRGHKALLDAFVRESAAYRSAVQSGKPADEALKQLEADGDFMGRLYADKTRVEAGFVAMDPTTGEVRAWVGSRDFTTDQFDHVSQARRQPGSTFKAFVYGTALEQGMTADTRFDDKEVDIPLGKGEVWHPSDVEPPTNQPMTLRDALAFSKNTVTAQVMQQVGPAKVVDFARRLGVQSPLDPVPSLALGTSPVSLLEMVTAYGAIADDGVVHKPLLIKRITDSHGKELASFAPRSRQTVSAKIAYALTDMLRAVVDRGTGQAIRSQYGLHADLAGKTGTTQDNTDGWFILMHPNLVGGSWVGFNDPRLTLPSGHSGEGARTALPIVANVFRTALHVKAVDARTKFVPPARAWYENAFDKVYGWFDQGKAPSAPPMPAAPASPAPAVPPSPDQPPADQATPPDGLDQIIEQSRQAPGSPSGDALSGTVTPSSSGGAVSGTPAGSSGNNQGNPGGTTATPGNSAATGSATPSTVPIEDLSRRAVGEVTAITPPVGAANRSGQAGAVPSAASAPITPSASPSSPGAALPAAPVSADTGGGGRSAGLSR